MALQKLDRESFDLALEITKKVRDATSLCCEPLANLTWETYHILQQGKKAGEFTQEVQKRPPEGGEVDARTDPVSTQHTVAEGDADDSSAGAEGQA